MADFILYGTEGCHLCEEAEQIVRLAGLDFDKQDIIEDEALQLRYGVKIPVLTHPSLGLELHWPFGPEQVLWLAAQARA
ncbi:glutaredoxin family protein [Methylomonas koyamae]|uniref:glutaredoxin family protein n=1 Tax=Methylomonas koyamae TaxID=702114 RepID=UPI0028736F85|nr:glutaredoxin family protein [Methylomonas koyamae]WNB76286.1 glutaredoxin family protein [Methylomonas koyamae]